MSTTLSFRKLVHRAQTRCCLTTALIALVSGASAASTVSFSGATVHTVSDGIIHSGHVLVRDGRIVSVTQTAPAGADETVDLQGLHLYPGLIDADTTLGLNEIEAVRATVDNRESGEFTPEVEAWVSINPDSELIPVSRANGVTHVNAVPAGGAVAGQASVVQLAGWTIEDHAVERRSGLHVYWPSMGLNTSPDNKKSLADQDRERLEAIQKIDTFFSEAAAYARVRAANGASPVVPAWEAMLPYVRGEKPVFIHAAERRQLRAAFDWSQRQGIKLVLVGARDAWRMAAELAAARVPVVYDAVHELPANDADGFDVHFEAPDILAHAGVKVALSLRPDMEETHARNLPYDAAQALAYGLSADVALKSITLHPAEILGVADRLGSIVAGKQATFFVADGDILDIRTQVKRVWIAGREVSLENRHTRLNEKYRNRPAK